MRSAICMASTAAWWAPPSSALCPARAVTYRRLHHPSGGHRLRRCVLSGGGPQARGRDYRGQAAGHLRLRQRRLGRREEDCRAGRQGGHHRRPRRLHLRSRRRLSPTRRSTIMLEMRASGRDKVQDYADKFGCEFHAGEKLGPGRRQGGHHACPAPPRTMSTWTPPRRSPPAASSTTSKLPTCPPPTTLWSS